MEIWVVEFSNGGSKIKIFLLKNQHTQRKLLNVENWISGGPQKFQKSEFLKLIISHSYNIFVAKIEISGTK